MVSAGALTPLKLPALFLRNYKIVKNLKISWDTTCIFQNSDVLMKKTEGQKSRDTVPLKTNDHRDVT
jgi:hypothetical protein